MQKKINIEKQFLSSKFLFKQKIYKKFGLNKRKNFVFIKKNIDSILKKAYTFNDKPLFLKEMENIVFLKEAKSYRGVRHRARLPVRGQRTHTNAKTARKKKKEFR